MQAVATQPPRTILEDGRIVEEVEAMIWLQSRVRDGRSVPVAEARLIADSIHDCVVRAGAVLPQAACTDVSAFLAAHAVNVSALATALAGFVGFDGPSVRRIGLAALLQDIGMLRLPPDLLVKQGQLTAEERRRIKEHPTLGAMVLLQADGLLDLPAVVAYEHHIKMDGSGYPMFRYPRAVHYITRLVQVCDVFHALRSARPFRKPWPTEFILSFLNERAGFEFHPTLVRALSRMIEGGAAPPLEAVLTDE